MAKIKSRNRIVEYKIIPSNQIQENPKNWRTHPDNQREAMSDILKEVGIVDAVMVRQLDNGNYELIDGHLRKDILAGHGVPSIVVDLDESEADLVLATYDPLSAMAGSSPDKIDSLLRNLNTSSQSLSDLLTSLAASNQLIPEDEDKPSHKKKGGGSFTDPDEAFREVRTIFQYPLIFDDEEQQATWFQMIRHLAKTYPSTPSIGGRLARFIEDYLSRESDG